MSRELKFRAWDKVRKKMFYKLAIESGVNEINAWFGDRFSAKYWTFMQYTGIKDKNGKEIYEGDVVRQVNYRSDRGVSGRKYVIEWKPFNASFGLRWVNHDFWLSFNQTRHNVEVIGNIYENPELVGGEK